MTESKPTTDAEIEGILAALANYTTGSSRAGLVPIDEAVCACLKHPARQAIMEQHLLARLQSPTSSEAKIYICQKLRLIGSANSVPALAELLSDPVVGDIARGTLELLPVSEAGDALRFALLRLSGASRLGVADALGHRRDPGNLGALEPGLKDPDTEFVTATITAIGRMGTLEAAKVLQRNLESVSSELRLTMAHACLECAWALRRGGHEEESDHLCRSLIEHGWPEHIVQAAQRVLDSAKE
jgi:HEAT repeat protein